MPQVKSKKSQRPVMDVKVGDIFEDLEVPLASEVVFRKVWRIRKFKKIVSKRDIMDSPVFRCSVNGITTHWNVAVRFWKGPNGKKVTNPLVFCLNLTGCDTEEIGQARIRYQFGVWNAKIRNWECCSLSNIILNLENSKDLLSVGYKTMGIYDQHIDSEKDVKIMVKLQIIHSGEEKHSLSQDLARVLRLEPEDFTDTIVQSSPSPDGQSEFKTSSLIIKARSDPLGAMLAKHKDERYNNIKYKLDLSVLDFEIVQELMRYIYSDKVDNAETHASKLLPLSTRMELPGLTALCERTLVECMTPTSVPNILLLADQYGCESLRRAALQYCEDSEAIKDSVQLDSKRSLAWRVMEMVNPNLFQEACESIGSSSNTIDSRGSYSDG